MAADFPLRHPTCQRTRSTRREARKRFSNLRALTVYNEIEHRNGKEISRECLGDSPDGALHDPLVKEA